jgi:hypothetical protein
MNIKKEAYDRIIKYLRLEIGDVDCQLKKNRREFRELEFQQTVLKRQKAELVKLISTVEGDKPKDNNV